MPPAPHATAMFKRLSVPVEPMRTSAPLQVAVHGVKADATRVIAPRRQTSPLASDRRAANARAVPDFAIIVPVFNEAPNVAPLAQALATVLAGRDYEVLFVDDWSTDGTAHTVTSLGDPRIRLLRRFGRRGLSSAVVEGALATMAPVIAVIDGDLQHDEAILPAMLDAVASGTCDVAIGSRYVGDGSTGDWDATRAAGSLLATRLTQRVLRVRVSDPMSGFFALRQDMLVAALPRLSNMGFKILADLLASSPVPLRVRELPYTFRSRVAGTSKLDSGVAVDFAMLLIDKATRGWLSPRLVMFGMVGALGLGVHLVTLRAALALGRPFAFAQTVAVVTAIAFNFLLNNQLTFRDRRLRGWRMVVGLASFYLVCGLGAVANIGVGSVAFARHYSWWLAGVAGAIVGSLWNFAASSLTTWRKRS
jgi:dolichol-phosphate mannosyltransferase